MKDPILRIFCYSYLLLLHNDSLEVLLTSADYQALSIKLLGSVSSLYIGNFLICYDNTTTAIRNDLKGYEFHSSGMDRFNTCYFE